MQYGIYQVKNELMRDYGFCGFEDAEKINGKGSVRLDNYDLIYEFDMMNSFDPRLDDVYEMFQDNRPSDFKGHSMSVSDVLRVGNDYYYCDDIGWKKLDWRDE